jgi:hypothetical protein
VGLAMCLSGANRQTRSLFRRSALDNLLTDQRSSVRAQRHCVAVIMVLAVLRDRGVYATLCEERGRHPSLPIRDDTPRGICEGYQK